MDEKNFYFSWTPQDLELISIINESDHYSFCLILTRMFLELQSRDREDGRLTGQSQELGPEAYLNSTSQGSRSEDDRRTAISAVAVGHS
jgi:hypothetical protein